jgi:Flp pilus assembly protein TadG
MATTSRGPVLPRRRRSSGQSLVEFALVLPVFMLLVFGILDGGRAILAYNNVAQSTRNVARVASVTCFDTTPRCDSTTTGAPVESAIDEQFAEQGAATWTVTCIDPITNAPPVNCNPGHIVRVSASSTITLITPFVSQAIGPVTVSAISEAEIIQ